MTDGVDPFPDFFVIGAQKAGTSTLCAMLDAHPQVVISNPKEPRIVSRMDLPVHPQMGMNQIEWWREAAFGDPRAWIPRRYAEVFPHYRADQLLGDGTTGTMLSRLAPAMIRSFRPDAKIIVVLRHPVHRAHSAYWHHVRHGTTGDDIRAFLLLENNWALATGCYEAVLTPWLTAFPRGRILVLVYEDFFQDPRSRIGTVWDFLGVERVPVAGDLHVNRGRYPADVAVQAGLNALRSQLQREGTLSAAAERALDAARQANLTEDRPPSMETSLFADLEQYFKLANAGLDRLLGQDVTHHWW